MPRFDSYRGSESSWLVSRTCSVVGTRRPVQFRANGRLDALAFDGDDRRVGDGCSEAVDGRVTGAHYHVSALDAVACPVDGGPWWRLEGGCSLALDIRAGSSLGGHVARRDRTDSHCEARSPEFADGAPGGSVPPTTWTRPSVSARSLALLSPDR